MWFEMLFRLSLSLFFSEPVVSLSPLDVLRSIYHSHTLVGFHCVKSAVFSPGKKGFLVAINRTKHIVYIG